jgi:membrane-bound metal-dependent hydrolase YbcI (DUF457 family)
LDNLTHTLFGATLARTPLGRAGRGTTAALIIASNAPDIDFVSIAAGPAKYLEWHRGITHGPLGVIGLAFVTAGIVAAARRLNPRWRHPDDAPFGMLVAISAVGVLFHVLMDLPTSYGTRILSPFSWRWYAVDWMPYVEIYLLVVLAAGLFFVPGRKRRGSATRPVMGSRRQNALIALTFAAAIYGLRAAAHHQALVAAPKMFGPAMPAECDPGLRANTWLDSWPRPAPSPPQPGRRCLVELAAIPAFLSPFDWRIVAQMSNAFELHDLYLLDRRIHGPESASISFWRLGIRYPNVWTAPVRQAAETHLGRVFLGFSRFPAARMAVDGKGGTTVRFTDVRFVIGPMLGNRRAPFTELFTATISLDAQGNVTSERLGR